MALAIHAGFQGALGIVLNKPTPNDLICRLKEAVDIPVTVTVVSISQDIKGRIASGVDILNVSGAAKTTDIIKKIRNIDEKVAVIATGGKTDETILEAISAGANAISYAPPSSGMLFREIMASYSHEI